MKALILDRYGKDERLRLGEMPTPELRDDDVLVQIHAAGVNPLDSKIRDGAFKLILPYRLPLILGHDVAGVVVKVGPRVRQFKLGDEVYARPDDFRIGTFAQFVPVKEGRSASACRIEVSSSRCVSGSVHPCGRLRPRSCSTCAQGRCGRSNRLARPFLAKSRSGAAHASRCNVERRDSH